MASREARSKDVGLGIFSDHEADWLVNRTLNYMTERAAEIGEVISTARQIDERELNSWIEEWAGLARKVEKQAEKSFSEGHFISSREAYLRASNYYRTAEYGALPDHPQFDELWKKSAACFQKAMKMFSAPLHTSQVDFDGRKLEAYFWRPDFSIKPRPTIIAAGGNDSSLEEVALLCGFAAIRRGYNFFTFDHPGHRGAMHRDPDCIKRPDYEVPYRAAIDKLLTFPGVDERIALTGYSFGGYVACRAAAHDQRIKAVIPNPPLPDFYQLATADTRDSVFLKLPDAVINWLVERKFASSPMSRVLVEFMLWTFGAPDLSPAEFSRYEILKPYSAVEYLNQISCPALALVGNGEGQAIKQQAEIFWENISSQNKEIHTFSLHQDGSNDHCQMDNRSRSNQIMFDWLDEIFSLGTGLTP